jgi:hypothetical protein
VRITFGQYSLICGIACILGFTPIEPWYCSLNHQSWVRVAAGTSANTLVEKWKTRFSLCNEAFLAGRIARRPLEVWH